MLIYCNIKLTHYYFYTCFGIKHIIYSILLTIIINRLGLIFQLNSLLVPAVQ